MTEDKKQGNMDWVTKKCGRNEESVVVRSTELDMRHGLIELKISVSARTK